MTTYIFILLAGLVTSACAPFVPVKSDYSKNERLKAVWDERVQNREHLRRTLQSTTDATEKTRVTQSIKAINAEIVQIKVNMGYPYGPPEPVEAKTAEQSLNSAYVELKLADWKYGIVIDNQGVNESSAGTNGGALLGSALGNAAYIDRSFRPGNNYSAVTQLGVGIFGAILGGCDSN